MSDKSEKRTLRAKFKARELEDLEAKMPLSKTDLKALLDHLNRPDCPVCDHTLKHTVGFLCSRKLNTEAIVRWLKEHGGYCDCEVVVNIESKFEKICRFSDSKTSKPEI